jgi:hypothetical protein
MNVSAGPGRKAACLTVAPPTDCPNVVRVLNVQRGELRELQVADRRNKDAVDDLGVTLVRLGCDLLTHRFEPSVKPIPHSDSVRIDMLAGVDGAKEAPQLLFRIFASTSHGCGGGASLASRGISPEAVTKLE